MTDFTDEFDYILERGWWFSVIPQDGERKDKWRCCIYRKMNDDSWNSQETKNFPTITKGMVWIELYLLNKLEEIDD